MTIKWKAPEFWTEFIKIPREPKEKRQDFLKSITKEKENEWRKQENLCNEQNEKTAKEINDIFLPLVRKLLDAMPEEVSYYEEIVEKLKCIEEINAPEPDFLYFLLKEKEKLEKEETSRKTWINVWEKEAKEREQKINEAIAFLYSEGKIIGTDFTISNAIEKAEQLKNSP